MPPETFTGSATPGLRRGLTASLNGLLDWHDAFTAHYGLTPSIFSEPNPGFNYTSPDGNQTWFRLAHIRPDRQLMILGGPVDQVLIEAQGYRGYRTPNLMFVYYAKDRAFQTDALQGVWTHRFMRLGKVFYDEAIIRKGPGGQINYYLTREEPEETAHPAPLLYLPNFTGSLEPTRCDEYLSFAYNNLELVGWTRAIGEERRRYIPPSYPESSPERLKMFPLSYDELGSGVLPFLPEGPRPLHSEPGLSNIPYPDLILADTPTNRIFAPLYRSAGVKLWNNISPHALERAKTVICTPGLFDGLLAVDVAWDGLSFYGEAVSILGKRVRDQAVLDDTIAALHQLIIAGVLKELVSLRVGHPVELSPAACIRALGTVLTIQAKNIEKETGDPNLAYEKPQQPTKGLPESVESVESKGALPRRSGWLARLTGR